MRCVCEYTEAEGVRRMCAAHQRLVDGAVAAEREACAKIAEQWGKRQSVTTDSAHIPGADHGERYASAGIADAIRSRQ